MRTLITQPFEMTVNISWSLIGLPMNVTVADQGEQTLVNVAVTSRWWLMTDGYGTYDQHIQDFVAAVKRYATAKATDDDELRDDLA